MVNWGKVLILPKIKHDIFITDTNPKSAIDFYLCFDKVS